MSNTSSTPAGWYPDTNNPGNERWWDGTAWGTETRPVPAPEAAAPAPAAPAPSGTPVATPAPAAATPPTPGAAVNPPPAQAAPAQPVPASAPMPAKKPGMSKGVLFALIGGMVLLLGGCVGAAIAFMPAGDDEAAQTETVSGGTEETVTADGDTEAGDATDGTATDGTATDDTTTEETMAEAGDGGGADEGTATDASDGDTADEAGSGDPMDIVNGCERIDSDNVSIDVFNNTGQLSSFILTIAYFDPAGQRVADETVFVNFLRAGERTIQNSSIFEDEGETCEIVDVELIPAYTQPEAVAEAGACELASEADEFGRLGATVSVTNSRDETLDYYVHVAFVDSAGVRVSGYTAYLEGVRSDETVSGDLYSFLDFPADVTCEVVGAASS